MQSETSYINTQALADRHIIDVLIEERAVKLMRRPALYRLIRALGDGLLGYERAVVMADDIANLGGRAAFDYLSNALQLDVEVTGIEHIPTEGAAIVTPNHPAGIADGIAVYDALKDVREDIIFLANRDAIRVSPGLAEIIVPVEWRDEYRTKQRNRETIQALIQAVRDERLIVIFPSGRLAQPTLRGLKERPWQITALNIAQKYNIRVFPMNVKGRNTLFYYSTWYINTELKDMTLFRELLNKHGQRYRLTIGEGFQPVGDAQEETDDLREFVLKELGNGSTKFR